MSENDYIAEYIKEKYPMLLGMEFGLWKFAKQITEAAKTALLAEARRRGYDTEKLIWVTQE